MLNSLVPYVLTLRERCPRLYQFLVNLAKRYLGSRLGIYPRPLANEVGAVIGVLRGSQWNMVYGKGLVHERLEASFSEYMGGGHAIAVNTGGMALQMAIRGLGLRPGDELIHQVDTCSATAMAVINAGCTPILADISSQTFMLDHASVADQIRPSTRAIVATHMWGNPENLSQLLDLKQKHHLALIEDACLALGARWAGHAAGSIGDVGVFSFGCLKPIQGGEGGMIFTRDESLARELRAMRHWGDRTLEYGVRDVAELAWNGRMSEIVAAVVNEQLRGYPAHLDNLREAVKEFADFIEKIDGLELVLGAANKIEDACFTQVVLRIDERAFGQKKSEFMTDIYKRGIQIRHANFELINSLTLFRTDAWKTWLPAAGHERVQANFGSSFPVAQSVFDHQGIGLGNMSFLSRGNLRNLMRQIEESTVRRR